MLRRCCTNYWLLCLERDAGEAHGRVIRLVLVFIQTKYKAHRPNELT